MLVAGGIVVAVLLYWLIMQVALGIADARHDRVCNRAFVLALAWPISGTLYLVVSAARLIVRLVRKVAHDTSCWAYDMGFNLAIKD